jgi:hypothetical protein
MRAAGGTDVRKGENVGDMNMDISLIRLYVRHFSIAYDNSLFCTPFLSIGFSILCPLIYFCETCTDPSISTWWYR